MVEVSWYEVGIMMGHFKVFIATETGISSCWPSFARVTKGYFLRPKVHRRRWEKGREIQEPERTVGGTSPYCRPITGLNVEQAPPLTVSLTEVGGVLARSDPWN